MSTPFVFAIVAFALFGLVFLAALICYSLREFSFSRLEEICRQHNNEPRFSVILKDYEPALLSAETLLMAAVLAVLTHLYSVFGVFEGWFTASAQLFAILVLLGLIGVIWPWALARVAGETVLYHLWPGIRAMQVLLRPWMAMGRETDKILHRVSGREHPDTAPAAAITDEIRTVVDEGQREGLLESEARTMIHRVIELQSEDVASIMTPRTDMVCIVADATLELARTTLLEAGHSRVPVIGESTDDIIGILYAKDLLRFTAESNGREVVLKEIVREPFYVPETMGIDTLLQTLKREHVHLAIVLDEYGGVAGLVSLEDILEEIVGEIVDEYDTAVVEQIETISPDVTELDARVHVDDLNERFEYGLPEDGDFETVGGFVVSILGRIPEIGEDLAWKHLRFTVLDADKRKINRLRIEVDRSLTSTTSNGA